MFEELHKQGVLTGCLVSFCLACNTNVVNDEATIHTMTADHRKCLSMVPYFDQFEGHFIRKFKTHYYCQFCNVTLQTAMKVRFHIKEDEHLQKRGTSLLRTQDGDIIAFNSIVIKERVWHGLFYNTCVICNIKFEYFGDECLHTSSSNHILNMILKNIKFSENDAIYRHINYTTVHCLTCDVLTDNIIDHLHSADHLNTYKKCEINVTHVENEVDEDDKNADVMDQNLKKDETDNTDAKHKEWQDVSKIVLSVSIYQSNDIDINFETNKAFCRRCCEHLQFNYNDIKNHADGHNKGQFKPITRYPAYIYRSNIDCTNNKSEDSETKPSQSSTSHMELKPKLDVTQSNKKINTAKATNNNYIKNDSTDAIASKSQDGDKVDTTTDANVDSDSTSDSENTGTFSVAPNDINSFAKDHKITYNAKNATAFCRTCQVRMPSSLYSMKEHVAGARHTKNSARTKIEVTPSYSKQKMVHFVNTLAEFTGPSGTHFLINDELFIGQLSFLLLIDTDFGLTCVICNSNILKNSFFINLHLQNTFHTSFMKNVKVITSLESEFVREIKPSSYHCGYCNILIHGWDQMKNHLENSVEHRYIKITQMIRRDLANGRRF